MAGRKRVSRPYDSTDAVPAIAIFARAITPGKTKTRLIPQLGRDGAAEFHRALVSDTLCKVAKLKGKAAQYLFVSGGTLPAEIVPGDFECRRQSGPGLGRRLERAFTRLLGQHSRVVIIGTDSPALTLSVVRLALEELHTTDAVLGPCPDGGYYLIGLRKIPRHLFKGIRLGGEFAFLDTLDSLLAHGLSCALIESYPDIDRPQDLVALKKSLVKNPATRRLMPQTWRFLSKMS